MIRDDNLMHLKCEILFYYSLQLRFCYNIGITRNLVRAGERWAERKKRVTKGL